MPPTVRLLVVDDHAIVREGLCRLLGTLPDFVVCGEAADGREAVARCVELAPDVVLMDIGMPGMDGIEATARIKEACPTARIMILTAYEDKNLVRLALKAGADGYLLKHTDRDRLAQAILALMEHGSWFEPELGIGGEDVPSGEEGHFNALTRREREILAMVAAGSKNKDVAESLCISVKTVEKHRANMMKKLGFHSVAELVAFALKTDFRLR